MDEIIVPLQNNSDRHGSKYYMGFPRLPVSIKLDEIVFFIFVSEDGSENLIIRPKIQKSDKDRDRKKDGEPVIYRTRNVEDSAENA
jgi:virulence-associated protein VagC